jgi:hypothetical protein
MIFVSITTRAGDVERLRSYARDRIAREQFDQLDNRGSVTLN